MTDTIDRLQNEVVAPLKSRFVGRDEVVDLIALALVAGEHLFLHGPPGTAKSALIRQFAQAVRGRYFEYMLTRFSEPNEIFGPVDIAQLREGRVVTVTAGMLPEAEFVFLDELFNANSAILNNLLTVLNERTFRRGAETHRLPLLSLFSASNHLPEDESLRALFDRFLLRCHVENLKADAIPQLLQAGWKLEQTIIEPASITTGDLSSLGRQLLQIELTEVMDPYRELVGKLRDLGIAFSDRRAVKVLKLIAASAILCNRRAANPTDLWVLRYVWDREEQIQPLAALVNGVLQAQEQVDGRHPLSRTQPHADGEQLAREVNAVEARLNGEKLPLSEIARLRERLATLSDHCSWLLDANAQAHLLGRIRQCLVKLD